MSGKRYFSYVRVSTARQGQTNTSLAEQEAAIARYAQKWNLEIVRQYEEQETAAKAGRPVFLEMLKALKQGEAAGVIIHKIDRGARNLKDWADLGSLIDSGVEVLFANEAIDLNSRGGRLSADIQAVVAADYIRNLREEVRKGFYGRLKQGLFPMPAPVGYLDCGQGKPKKPHPAYAPLVKQAFELYSTGNYSIAALTKKMDELGLRNRNDRSLGKNTINDLLKNKFYTGLIEIEKTGEIYVGQHEPLVSQMLFNEVQAIMSGKKADKEKRHYFVFRRLIECRGCFRKLVPERQKGWVYYRCQTRDCKQKTMREETIEKQLLPVLSKLKFTDEENRHLAAVLLEKEGEAKTNLKVTKQSFVLKIEQCRQRLSKLTDALVDETIDREIFIQKKNLLLLEEQRLGQQLEEIERGEGSVIFAKVRKILELANRAYLSYKSGIEQEKREMVEIIISNFSAIGKTVLFKLNYPFEIVANRGKSTNGGPHRDVPRTDVAELSEIVKNLYEYVTVADIHHK